MSGHSKWSNIKHRKEKGDLAKAKVFTKIGREMAVAVREGGSDPAQNSHLRDVIAKAKAANMPNDNIQRSIAKAAGELGDVNYEEITYEGYAPGGVAVIVQALTDNRNRTAADVRHAFDKLGGSLGATGCVSWMFDRTGVVVVDAADLEEEQVLEIALEAGADDMQEGEEVFEVLCQPAALTGVREALEAANMKLLSAELDMIPQNTVAVTGDAAATVQLLIERLEDNDDVQQVYSNAEFDEE